MGFVTLVGYATLAWFGIGLLCGLAFVLTRPAMFFSAGFRWGAMGLAVLTSAPAWPFVLHHILGGERRAEAEDAEERRRRSRMISKMLRDGHARGDWYRAVSGVHHKLLVDANGRPVDPGHKREMDGLDIEHVEEADHPCKNGTWTEGACSLCGAPERGASACGMEKAETIDMPQYDPPARPMRNAPAEGRVLAVSNPGREGKRSLDRASDRFHVVSFRPNGAGGGVWVDGEGKAVDRLHGWWRMPRMRRSQVHDMDQKPEVWTGEDVPPEAPWKVERRERHEALRREIAEGR